MRSIGSITLAAAIAASFTLAMPVPAQAQGLFDFLGSIFRGSAPRAYNREPPRLLDGLIAQPDVWKFRLIELSHRGVAS